MDPQISIFAGGRITDFAGALVQGTFNGVASSSHLDNSDLRLTTPFDVNNTELRLGLDINNGPTVQDPYNSSYAWGYPYVSSILVPTPTAQPLLAGGLIGNSIGTTVYAWYDRSLYLEGGLYNTFGPSLLSWTGNAYGPGSTANPAPYLRAAYEWNWNGQSAHVGGIFLHSNFNPATSAFSSDGSMGHDSYTDYAVDGGYQFIGDGTHVFSVLGSFDHENQNLVGSFNSGAASQAGNTLNQTRVSGTYYYRQTYGITVAWQKTWGTPDPLLYAPAPVSSAAANGEAGEEDMPHSNRIHLRGGLGPLREGRFLGRTVGQPKARGAIHAVYAVQRRRIELRRIRPQRGRQQRAVCVRLDDLLSGDDIGMAADP